MKILILCLLLSLNFAVSADIDYPHSTKTGEAGYGRCADISDPLEKLNRKIFIFNGILDHFILSPISRGYRNAVSEESRAHIGNALNNAAEPTTTINYALQAEGHKTLLSFWRFVINSTLGVGGFEDVAKKRGIYVRPQTLGSSLAHYGVGPGPYVVLPFFGGTNSRDMFDSAIANSGMNAVNYKIRKHVKYKITAARMIHERSEILPFTDHVLATSTDPYTTIKSAIHQAREKSVDYPKHYRCKNYD